MPVFQLTPLAPLFRSIAGDALSKALYMAESETLKQIMSARRECVDYYKNEVLEEHGGDNAYLKDFFRTFNKEKNKWDEPAKLDMLLTHIPVTAQLIDLKARIYTVQPDRKVRKGGKAVQASEYTQLLKDSGFFSMSKEIERYTQLLSDVAVGVFAGKEGRLQFVMIPEYYPVFADDDEFQLEPVGIVYPTALRETDGSQVWAYWDKDVRRRLNQFGEPTQEEKNPYSVFNFFFPHRKKPTSSHTSLPRVELINQNRQIDMAVTGLNKLLHYNGFKQLVVIGDTDDTVTEFKLGNTNVLKIKPIEGVAAQLQAYPLDMQANFNEHVSTIKFQMELASNALNLNFNWSIDTGQVSSGRALQIKNVRDTEDRTTQTEILDEFIEQPLYRIVSKMGGKFGIPKVEQGELVADFEDQESGFQSVADEIAWNDHLHAHNVLTDLDLIMKENPDLSKEEALKQLDDNRKINAVVVAGDENLEATILSILHDKDRGKGTLPSGKPTGTPGEDEDGNDGTPEGSR